MGLDALIIVFWMLNFKPAFSLSSFTPIKSLFNSSSISALEWCHVPIWGCWYFSWQSWFQLVIHPVQHFAWCTLHEKWMWSRSVMPDSLWPWTVAHQAPLSMGFSRQENWSGLSFPSQGIFPTQRLNPGLLHCRKILYHLSYNTSCEMPDWMNHKLESRLLGEISTTSDTQMIPL